MSNRSSFDFDATVIGAGAVGLAIAARLARNGRRVAVLEKESGIGQGISSRNSEVIHAGLYYPPGSLRARLCVEGRRRLYGFLESHGVAHERCGKLVVASVEADLEQLYAVSDRATANGVEDIAWLSGQEARKLEPNVRAVAALLSPQTGIIDSHGFMLALLGEMEDHGGVLARATPFVGAKPLAAGGFDVRTGGTQPTRFTCERLVVSAGLSAQSAAAAIESYPTDAIPPLYLAKGVYFRLNRPTPFRHLVYPPPVPGALGIHFTRDLAGQGRFGPDIEFVDAETYAVDADRAVNFYEAIRRYWPALPDGSLEPDYAAIRPKIHGPGEAQPDFRIDGPGVHGVPGLVALFGIESPGLTCALALGDHVRGLLEGGEV